MKILARTLTLVLGIGLAGACSSADEPGERVATQEQAALLCGGSCSDGDPCTLDTCNLLTGQCSHVGICCTRDQECDDGLVCTVGHCTLGGCIFNPILGCDPPGGTGGAGGTGSTDGGAIQCGTNDDCSDGEFCTVDTCRPDGTCAHTNVPLCCAADSQCDDGLLCTVGACVLGQCIFNPITGCSEGTGGAGGSASGGSGGSAASGGSAGGGSGGSAGSSAGSGGAAGGGSGGGGGVQSCATAGDCGDGDPCTLDLCVEPNLVCVHVDLGVSCSGSGGAGSGGASSGGSSAGGNSAGGSSAGGTSSGGSSAGGASSGGSSAGGSSAGGTTSGGSSAGGSSAGGSSAGGTTTGGSSAGGSSAGGAAGGTGTNGGAAGAEVIGAGGSSAGGSSAGGAQPSGGAAGDNGLDGGLELRGGACSCDISSNSRPTGSLWFFLAGCLVWLRRRAQKRAVRKSIVAAGTLAAAWVAPQRADAQGFALDRSPAPTLPDDLLWTERAAPEGGDGVPFARLALGFSDDPLIAKGLPGGDVNLVDEQYAAYASVGVALIDRLTIALMLPIYSQTGNAITVGTTTTDFSGTGIGDPGLDARLTLLGRSAPIELALATTLRAPLGDETKLMGDDGFSLWPRVLIGRGIGSSFVGAQIGANLRPSAQVADLDVGNELTLGAGAQVGVLDWLAVTGEVTSSTGLDSPLNEERTPVGFMVGLRGNVDSVVLAGGAGPGSSPGYGAPDVRALASAATYFRKAKKPEPVVVTEQDADGDGILDSVDSCPQVPEDFDGFEDQDGCPELDNDKDGIADAKDKCPLVPEDRDGFEDEDGCPELDNDQDGIPDAKDKCPLVAEDLDGFEDEDGCPDEDNDKDGIADAVDKCPLEPETINGKDDEDGCPDLVRVVKGEIQTLEPIFFEYNSAKIQARSTDLLQEMAKVIASRADLGTISIEGHTDSRGPDAYNLKLSTNRAASVKAFLLAHGVPEDRLTSAGFGESKPIADNATNDGRARNRRVEFRFNMAPSAADGAK